MILNYVNPDSVVAKIIRDTGIEESTLLADIEEWMAEAMDAMNVQMECYPTHKDLKVSFHAAKIPKGCVGVMAVSSCGYRLRYRNRDNDPRAKVRLGAGVITAGNPNSVFETDPMTVEYNPVTGVKRPWPYPVEVRQMPFHEEAWYQIKGGYIWTSFKEGTATIHFETVPMSESGLPMIPDNMNLKEALYYHTRGKMVASGRYKDPVFSIGDILRLYEQYSSRAIEQITYPTPDQMESMIDTWVRLVPANHYFKNFSDPIGPEQFYDTFGEQRSLWHEV